MIVLFIKSDLIRHQPLPGHPCPQCAKTDGMDMELRQRYAQFATMTVNPKGVFGLVNCLHCGYTLPASRWTDTLHQTYKALKAGYKTPLSYWKGTIGTAIGLAVGTILIYGILMVSGKQQTATIRQSQAATELAMKRPMPGITLASIANGRPTYDIWRVSHVSDDTVWLRKYTGNRTLTNFYQETGWASLPDANFSAAAVAYARAGFADKGLKRVEHRADKTRPYDGVIISVLNK